MNEIVLNEEFILSRKFKTATEFSVFIEEYSIKHRCGYMDAVIDYCTKSGIDLESIGPLVSKSLKEKIRVEATEANFFKKRGTLQL
jgi:aryl-alcohol dehydrogenase-like predicted oxidoreductase